MRTWIAFALAWAAGCAAPDTGATSVEVDERPLVLASMRERLAAVTEPMHTQIHGPFVLLIRTDAATAERINRFMATLLDDYGRWFRRPKQAIRVFVFDTREAMFPHLKAILGDDAPAEPSMGRYYHRFPNTVTCSMQWGLGWLADLCLRAQMAADWDGITPPPNRWFFESMQSVLYNCHRTPDGRFCGLNVQSYYRPQAQTLKDEGRLIPIGKFLRDDYDPKILKEDALRVQGREFLAWLLSKGLLRDFYEAFRDHFAHDPSGLQALNHVMGGGVEARLAKWEPWLMAADAEIGDSAMGKPFPVLGVLIARESSKLPGVGIFEVCPGGPADRAGLKHGDRVLSIGGTRVESRAELLKLLQAGAYGRTAKVQILRGKTEQTVNVVFDRYIDG